MTENKRYFKKEYDEEYYIFDSEIISEKRVDKFIEYDYKVFASSMTDDEIVDRLNEQEERIQELETDNFSFTFTEDYERINNNTLEVLDKHTTIQMNGDRIHIVVIPPKSKPYSFKYYITGITFEYDEINSGDVE